MPSEITHGWVKCTIGDIYDFEYGKALKKEKRNEKGVFPVLGSNGIVGFHDDFLVKGPGIVVGRKGAAGEVTLVKDNFWPIDTTYYIRFKSNQLSVWFSYYLLKAKGLNQFEKSTAIPGLNRNDAYEKEIHLSPLPEQHAIVSKIEQLFSELDKGIESLKTAQQQLKVYRQSVLKWAFEGKLTEQWWKNQDLPDAQELLGNIQKEREEKAKASGKKIKPVAPLKKELAALPELPEGWGWVRSGKLYGAVTSGSRGWAKYYSAGGAMSEPNKRLANHFRKFPDYFR